MNKTSPEALERAVRVLGGQTNLGLVCGKKQGHVSYWLDTGKLPAGHCIAVESATAQKGEIVTRYELRADVFGSAPEVYPKCGCFHDGRPS